jgi:YVTN family beta-propeller protein
LLALAAAGSFSVGGVAAAATFANFESHQVRPLALTPDGTRLLAVNTPDNRLTVFLVTPESLSIEAEIPVGLEPVSVQPRSDVEAWVVNHLSDAISIVDLTTRNVRATLAVGDEPTDVVFAGVTARAFVCVSQEDAVKVFDPVLLGAPLHVVSIFGSDPRALAVSPDGARVYAAIFESGNRTSVLSAAEVAAGGGLPAPSPPMSASLPPAPEVGLIVKWTGAGWVDETGASWHTAVPIPYTLPDDDVVEIDANAALPGVVRAFGGVGTLNFGVTVNPVSGVVFVTNTEAMNLTRFEPNLSGRFAQSRITRIDPAGAGSVTPVHLNAHIDYGVSPGPPSETALSLSQPCGADWDSAGVRLFVAALGSDKLAVLDASGAVTARIDVGAGPTGVVVDDARGRVYVLERFANRVGIVSTTSLVKIGEASLGFQPEPAAVTEGRRFLYSARTASAHGDLACASCHPFAHFDNIAWDLGNPQGQMEPAGQFGVPDFHPMKGPMTTQSLRGLATTEPFHWRGDRADFARFNPAFRSLLGAPDTLAATDMQSFADFVMTVVYPPNPSQNLDRTYPDPAPPAASAERGRVQFVDFPHDGSLRCQDCHQSVPESNEEFEVAPGTNGLIIAGQILQESQAFKIPHLRNMYEKTGFGDAPGPQKRGFGFLHDGSIDDLVDFLRLPVFQFASDAQRRDVEAFLLAFDTGTAPAVGAQRTADAANKNDAALVAWIGQMMARADAGDIDLVVKGRAGGAARGYLYVGAGLFESDRESDGAIAESALRGGAAAGAERTYTGVPPGSGERIGIDRDGDGFRDGDEALAGSDPADAGSTPVVVDARPGAGATPGGAGALRSAPNPAGAAGAEISFSLGEPADVSLAVYDAQGRRVATPLDRSRQQGTVTLRWDGRTADGTPVASGAYFLRLDAAGKTRITKILVVH